MPKIVMLDTNVASGFLGKTTASKEADAEAWTTCITGLVAHIQNSEIVLPPPVIGEVAAKNRNIYSAVEEIAGAVRDGGSVGSVFAYIGLPISSTAQLRAARYRLDVGQHCDAASPDYVDALLAAYALMKGHAIITMNQKDFPEKFFRVGGMCLAPMPNPKSTRRIVYLLHPNRTD